MGWEGYVYNHKYLITIDEFGTSGSIDDIKNHYEFTIEKLTEKIKNLIR
jgi:transketolase